MNYELKELSFGELIGRAVNLYLDNFVSLFLVTLVGQIPSIFLLSWFTEKSAGLSSSGLLEIMPVFYLGTVIITLFSVALTGFSTKIIANRYLGREINFNEIISAVLPLVGALIVASFLTGLLSVLAAVALIFPMFIVSMGLSMVTPIIVTEKMGPIDGMKRSWALTKGKKGHLFGLFFVAGLISTTPVSIITQMLDTLILQSGMPNAIMVYSILVSVLSALFAPVASCVLVLAYFNLRIQKEGFDVEHLAQQFDYSADSEVY